LDRSYSSIAPVPKQEPATTEEKRRGIMGQHLLRRLQSGRPSCSAAGALRLCAKLLCSRPPRRAPACAGGKWRRRPVAELCHASSSWALLVLRARATLLVQLPAWGAAAGLRTRPRPPASACSCAPTILHTSKKRNPKGTQNSNGN